MFEGIIYRGAGQGGISQVVPHLNTVVSSICIIKLVIIFNNGLSFGLAGYTKGAQLVCFCISAISRLYFFSSIIIKYTVQSVKLLLIHDLNDKKNVSSMILK